MADRPLRLLIRTPDALVVDEAVAGLRVSTETGMAGLRPRGEPMVLAVEPGLVVLRRPDDTLRFAATAGGLLHGDRDECTLYTPYAAVGDSEAQMLEALDGLIADPRHELQARRQLGELEQSIVHELSKRHRAAPSPPRRRHA